MEAKLGLSGDLIILVGCQYLLLSTTNAFKGSQCNNYLYLFSL